MNAPTTPSHTTETKLVLLFMAKKLTMTAFRWGVCVFLGIIAWVVLDRLPSVFFWFALVVMMASMSIHTVLHRRPDASFFAKQACRYAFFLSFPLLFIFAGNRLAVWAVADDASAQMVPSGISKAQGVVASEAYLMLKNFQKESLKDPSKFKKGFKKVFAKQLAHLKEMDKTARILLIVLGAILLILILVLIAVVVSVNQSVDSCLGSSSSNDGCM